MKAINEAAAEVRPADNEVVVAIKAALKRQDKSSWEIADGFLELTRRGWTQERIAQEFQVSQSNVSKHVNCAKTYSLGNNRPSFWTAYREVNATPERLVPTIHTERREPQRIVLKIRNTATPPPQKITLEGIRHVPLGSAPAALPPPMPPPEEEDDDEACAVEVPALQQVMQLLPRLTPRELRAVQRWLTRQGPRKPKGRA
jgi:hypothetical protein